MNLPSGTIFVNHEISDDIKARLQTQLSIDETIDGIEFDNRVIQDPNYPQEIKTNNLRLLVIRTDYRDLTNRELADVAIFYYKGLAYIEENNFGPPGKAFDIQRFTIYNLLPIVL